MIVAVPTPVPVIVPIVPSVPLEATAATAGFDDDQPTAVEAEQGCVVTEAVS
jgi:hypothetical protein